MLMRPVTSAMRVGARLDLADVGGGGRQMGVRGTSVLAGARVELVNDVVTTGAGMRLLAELTRAAGAEVVGGAWCASRAPVDVASMLSAPTVHVSDLLLAATEADVCAQCLDNVPLQLAVDLN
jgi:orotate phosphoribosyltransferase